MTDTDRDSGGEAPGGGSASPPGSYSEEPVPRDLYDDTFIGQSLADLIEQMRSRHQELVAGSDPAAREGSEPTPSNLESFASEVEAVLPAGPRTSPLPVGYPGHGDGTTTPHPDGVIQQMIADLGAQMRQHLEASIARSRSNLETEVARRVARVKEAAVNEIRRRGEALRARYRSEYTQREDALRLEYEKLMSLAHRVSRQRAEIKRATRQLGDKLKATARLQREIGELRAALVERIDRVEGFEHEQQDEA